MKYKLIYLGLCFITLTVVTSNINWGKEKWKRALESDAKGFYAYNPALFIYHDPQFSFWNKIDKKYNQEHLEFDFRSRYQGIYFTNKFYVGTSILQMPFFLGAHILTKLQKGDADGYSKLYMQAIQMAAIMYAILGLYFLFHILDYYKIKAFNQIFVSISIMFGTNAFVYTIVESGMSHIYSFFLICLFLFIFIKWVKSKNYLCLPMLAITLALITLCRPTNLLIALFLPFINKTAFLDLFKINLKIWRVSILLFLVILSIQLWWYYAAFGQFFHYSYEYETFNFLNPQVFNILFSYKKGLFVYTPIYLLSLFGLWHIYRKDKFNFVYYICFFLLITYVFSSWWMWYYGASFSSRVYVDYLAVFAIPYALLLQNISKRFKPYLMTITIALIVLCQIQSYQYRYYIIHYSDMTKQLYWENFMKLNK